MIAPPAIPVRINALAAADGAGALVAPVSMLVEMRAGADAGGWHNRLVAIGRPAEVAAHPAAGAASLITVDRPRSVLIPGLVNAHTHLDLTHLGPQPHDPAAGFVSWIERIRTGRRTEPAEIAASVGQGLALAAAAGTVAVGDIAGAVRGRPSLAAWRALRAAGMRGVSYLEFFAIGAPMDRALAALREVVAEAEDVAGGPALGLQPHAPNTMARRGYRVAVELAAARGLRLSTHLAETPEERAFVQTARGPQRTMLEQLGIWSDDILDDIGRGRHPVQHLADILAATPMLAAHVNDADDAAIETLAATGASVAYCPHASEYFGAASHFGPHRYRDMLAAGVNVAIGTDSVVNLPVGADGKAELSVLTEIRRLYRRDGTDPVTLLRMATLNGARALGLPPGPFGFATGGPVAGVLAIEIGERGGVGEHAALAAALANDTRPEVLFADNHSGLAGILPGLARAVPTLTCVGNRGSSAS